MDETRTSGPPPGPTVELLPEERDCGDTSPHRPHGWAGTNITAGHCPGVASGDPLERLAFRTTADVLLICADYIEQNDPADPAGFLRRQAAALHPDSAHAHA